MFWNTEFDPVRVTQRAWKRSSSPHRGGSNGFIFQGKATRTDGTTAENVKHLEFYVPTCFGPQNLIWSELHNERGSDLHLRTTVVRMVYFQGKATRTNGTTAENMKHLEFYVPKAFGPQNLIRSELRNERGSDLHLRTAAVRMV